MRGYWPKYCEPGNLPYFILLAQPLLFEHQQESCMFLFYTFVMLRLPDLILLSEWEITGSNPTMLYLRLCSKNIPDIRTTFDKRFTDSDWNL